MGLYVKTLVNSPVSSNCFVISDKAKSTYCIIIDPGTPSCENLIDYLTSNFLIPEYVILTHEHFDHISGVPVLKRLYDFKLIASVECSKAIQNPKLNLSLFRDGIGFSLYAADVEISNHTSLVWNGYWGQIYIAKGHSSGSILFELDDNIFTGDTLLWNTQTVTKLPTGSKKELEKSLDLLKSLSCQKNMHVYAGHGIDFDLKKCVDMIWE